MEKIGISKLYFREDLDHSLTTVVIDFRAQVENSIFSLFCNRLPVEIREAQPIRVRGVLNEVKLTYLSYLNILFLLFKDSNLNIKVFNVKKEHSSYTRLQISFSFLNVLDNFRHLLNTIYNKMPGTSGTGIRPLIFSSEDDYLSHPYLCIDSYSELRIFFDFIVPKLNEYNDEFLSYSNKYGKLSIKINYKNIFLDLWNHFTLNRHYNGSQKYNYLKKKIPNRTRQILWACIILSISLIAVCGIILISFNSGSMIVFNVLTITLIVIDVILYEALSRLKIFKVRGRKPNNKLR